MSTAVSVEGFTPVFFSRGLPSNLFGAPIWLTHPFTGQPHRYRTNEHRFHAMKGRNAKEHDRIASQVKALAAKAAGRALKLSDAEVAAWDSGRAVMVMTEANLAKYTQHSNCRAWLLATGDRPLIEHRPDPIWGDNLDGTGQNLLGRILELVRAMIRVRENQGRPLSADFYCWPMISQRPEISASE